MEEDSTFLHPRGQSPLPPKSSSSSYHEAPQGKPPPNRAQSEDWRPLSLRKPVLLSVLVLSLLLFACIEALAQLSYRNGGLVFYSSLDDIPRSVSFAYTYLPTILATLFSLLWNWIDLDVKRVQPWIEVSKSTGAIAKNSVFLDYSSDFLAFAPVRAARLRHWPVFFSGSAAILILWVLTPLQSSLFGEPAVSHTTSTMVTARSQFLPPDDQIKLERYLHLSYSIGILNQSYPAFTTSKYALLPFYLEDSATVSSATTNWTAETTKLWTEASCSPVKTSYAGVQRYGGIGYNFTGNEGCRTVATFVQRDKPWPKVIYRDNTLAKENGIDDWVCLSDSKTRYYSNTSYSGMIYWFNPVDPTNTTSSEFNFTAIECELSYYKQQVRVTVDSNTLEPFDDSIKPLSKPSILGSDEFNSVSYVAAFPESDPSPIQDASFGMDYPDGYYPIAPTISAQASQLDSLFRYALLGREYDINTFSEASVLETLFQNITQQLFSLAISTRLTNQTKMMTNDVAELEKLLTGIVVSRPFAIASEVLLLLGACVLGYLCFVMKPSSCILGHIPSSIGGFIDIAHNSPEAAKLFQTMDTANEDLMKQALGEVKLHIVTDCSTECNKLSVVQGKPVPSDEEGGMAPKPYYKPVKPWILRRGTGIALAAVLVAGVVVLSYFKKTERKNNGLKRPSNNFQVLQILENYIPTIFATLIEPFWVLLARTMCIFQPFKDLWKGKSQATRSIEARYTSLPPQLALFEAITTRKLLLSLLCFAALLANVLAIGLSALFNERPAAVYHAQEFQPLYQSRLNPSTLLNLSPKGLKSISDKSSLFMALANISYGSQLSPWTTTEYYFQPVDIIELGENSTSGYYNVRTRGFGTDINCTSYSRSSHRLWFDPDSPRSTAQNITCIDPMEDLLTTILLGASSWEGGDEVEVSYTASTVPYMRFVHEYSFCRPNITFGWARAPQGVAKNNTIMTSYATCQPIFQTAMFNVTINREGYVLGYERVGEMESSLNYYNSSQHVDLLLATFNGLLYNYGVWSGDKNTTGWFSQFMYLDTKSRDFLDPSLPVPDPETLIPSIRRVYSRLFPPYLSTLTDLLLPAADNTSIMGTRRTEETRIFMDNTAFIITLVVLAVDFLIALAFYLPESLYVLPRLPSSAASILAYIAPSRAVRDGRPSSGWKDQTFSFGRYLGYDGKAYVGVEMDQYVVEKDISLGSYKPLLPPSFTNNLSERNLSLSGDDQSRSS